MSGRLQVGGLRFEVRRSPRRRTFALTVDRQGDLVAHAPSHTRVEPLRKWIRSKLLWVHRKLGVRESLAAAPRPPEFVSGETIVYLGRNCRLQLVAQQKQPLDHDGDRFLLRRRDRVRASSLFRAWYIRTGRDWIADRLKLWIPRTGTHPSRISVRDLGYRWGSCGRNGVLYFNWRLMQLPVPLVDYILVHELVHLREKQHNRNFWHLIELTIPDWKTRATELQKTAARHLTFGVNGISS